MESVVPPEVTAELTQILSNLVLGDNEIRSSAEMVVNERLEQTPEVYLLALTQFATSADTEVMRSFSLILLRRLLFRSVNSQNPKAARITLYDRLSSQTLTNIERLLLHCLSHEPIDVVRRKAVDTVCDLANNSMSRGRPWHALQAQAFAMAQHADPGARETAFRLFAGCPNLVMDLQTDAVLGVLKKGLQDPDSIGVRLSALRASLSYLTCSDAHQRAQSLSLMYPMLETLPPLPHAHLPKFINTLTPLTTVIPSLFQPHIPALLTFLPSLLLPSADPGPTPTVARPFPNSGSSFTFPPESTPAERDDDEDEEASEVRKSVLEFMVSLSEARPAMVRNVDGWVSAVVRGCLAGMGELRDDELDTWLEADPSEDPTDDTYPHVYEQALDRLACTLGGEAVLPVAFQHIPGMLANHDWRLRHAGLMAIAAVGEGTSKVMLNELGKVVELITPLFSDSHPRVRYAACQCVGQLCTDLEEVIQANYHRQLFGCLIPTLEASEPRVHAHAAAALINFCEGVKQETLVPYLDPIVERLLNLLNPSSSGRQVKRYVQEQAVTTLAMVADASETTFAKHYPSIMPLLLNILRSADTPEYRKLRAKAMECAGLIAIAVGKDVFRADASAFVDLLIRIQNSPPDPGDAMMPHYLIATWAKICQAMGPEFEPYLPVVMPPLLRAASVKADVVSVLEDDNAFETREGWETIKMDGQRVSVRTAALEEKNQAFETLVIHCSTLGPGFAPYLVQTLELALPSLRFIYHEGVREACAMLIPMLVSCGKASNTLTTQMAAAVFSQLTSIISTETDPTFLSSLYDCYSQCLRVIGGPGALGPEYQNALIEATKRQLADLAEKRKARTARSNTSSADEREDLALREEIEDFALEDMGKLLTTFDPAHPLLIAVSSVRDLGFRTAAWDEMDGTGQ